MLKRKSKLKEIDFTELLESNGNYGVKLVNVYGKPQHFIEFKEISRAVNKEGKEICQIKVIKITSEGKLDKEIYESWMSRNWLEYCNSNDVYWFKDNDSRKRDLVINNLIKDENS
jgi:hypothetical protein